MTSVLITSDSHGLTKELEEMKEKHTVDLYIHCGDSELDFDAAELSPFIKLAEIVILIRYTQIRKYWT